jgi:hypothetical protein
MNDRRNLDCIYVTASSRDARFTRSCVASIRYFYPEAAVKLLVGGRLESGLAEEMQQFWNVSIADFPHGDYGWGFVKLEPLFGSPGERFLVLDSDTVFAGPVLGEWQASRATFLVDRETQSESDTRRLYYDWQKVREVDPDAQPPRFVFNSGQWFGTAGVLRRDDFAPWLEWTMPRRLRYPQIFMLGGDQGILNYVLNQKAALDGLSVETAKIMHWPRRGISSPNAESVMTRTSPPVVIHWAGLKKARLQDMPAGDLLGFFEELYYGRLPGGKARRQFAACRYVFSNRYHAASMHLKLGVNASIRRGKHWACL